MAELDVPYYSQTSEFTCGPACVLMTVAALHRDPFELARVHEFEVWRRCHLIGMGGTDAFGFALPFLDRDLEVQIYNETIPTFPEDLLLSFLTEQDATLARWSSKQAREECQAEGAEIHERAPELADVEAAIEDGWVPNCLVGMDEVHDEEIPHWVIPVAVGDETVRFHDPYPPRGEANLEIDRSSFAKMLEDPRAMDASRAMVLARSPPGEGTLRARVDVDA